MLEVIIVDASSTDNTLHVAQNTKMDGEISLLYDNIYKKTKI